MPTAFKIVIPSRYQSSRFPGKPLADIQGKTMIQRVHEKAIVSGAEQVIVATDDNRIADHVKSFGGEVCMTSEEHESGTERIAEVAEKYQFADDDIVVNVQGDEPFIPQENIIQVAENLAKNHLAVMSTLSVEIKELEEVFDPNAVKVVADKTGYAMYFSRAPIPYNRDEFKDGTPSHLSSNFQRHIGIYAYRTEFIRRYVSWPASELEHIESLEQLRVLWHGEKIHLATALKEPPAGIDTPQDLKRAISLLEALKEF